MRVPRRLALTAARLRLALIVGVITAAGTAGALLGFGLRAGTPARPFNAIARLVLGPDTVGVWGFDARVSLTGIVLHVTAMLLYGVALVSTGAKRGWRLAVAAVGVSLFAFAVERLLLHLVPAESDLLVPGQVVALHLLMAVCLALGMRFALLVHREDT